MDNDLLTPADPAISSFAQSHNMIVTKNHWGENDRELRWQVDDIWFTINIDYEIDQVIVEVSAWMDVDRIRLWSSMVVDYVDDWSGIPAILDVAFDKAEEVCKDVIAGRCRRSMLPKRE